MKRSFLPLLTLAGYLLGGCAAPFQSHPVSKPYYVTRPARTLQNERVTPAVVFIDERTLIWMNAAMQRSRSDGIEGGGCAHIEKVVGEAFYVDSIMPPEGNSSFTPTHGHFGCFTSEAPIHWHPIVDPDQCVLSHDDTTPQKAKFVFELMQCGYGIDSVFAVTVRPEAKIAGRGNGKGK